jgi:hypothetical protein
VAPIGVFDVIRCCEINPRSCHTHKLDSRGPKLYVSSASALSDAKQTRPDHPSANKSRRLKAVQQDFNHNDPENPFPGRLQRPGHRDRKCPKLVQARRWPAKYTGSATHAIAFSRSGPAVSNKIEPPRTKNLIEGCAELGQNKSCCIIFSTE